MSHNHRHETAEIKGKKLLFTILLNLGITLLQLAGGVISGSMALISDALHNFTDVLSLIISWVAAKLSTQKNTLTKTFGYKRAEIVAAFINASTLIGIALYLAYEAAGRILNPQPVKAGYVIWLAVASIAVNGLSTLLLRKESAGNLNIRSSYLHLLTDLLTSVAVLLGGLAIYYFGFYRVDGIITVIIALFLIYSGWQLLLESLNIILMMSPADVDVERLVAEIESLEGIKNLHHLHVWRLTEHQIHMEAHIDLEEDLPVSDFEQKLRRIEEIAGRYGIEHVTIQPEFDRCDDKGLIHHA